jgi:Flp pilus assembly protein TadG
MPATRANSFCILPKVWHMRAYKKHNAARNLRTIAGRFLRDRRGVAALEFALIAPVIILLYLGSVELTTGLDVNKNLGRAGSMVADLVTQQQTITKADITNIMAIAKATMLPYQRDTPQIKITAIDVPVTGSAKVVWSRQTKNGVESTPYTAGSTANINANLLIPGTSVIRVETNIAYVPLIAWTIKGKVSTANGTSVTGLAMANTSFGRVRQGAAVACSDCP